MNANIFQFFKNYYNWRGIFKSYISMLVIAGFLELAQLMGTIEQSRIFHQYSIMLEGACAIHFILLQLFPLQAFIKYWWEFRSYVKIKSWPQYKAYIWTLQQLREQHRYFKNFPKEKEVIVASAIKALNGDVYAVMKPGRHHHCIALMWEKQASELHVSGNTINQGFMTNTNRYIGRKEARELAVQNGQALYLNHADEIFSENLWETPEEMKEPSLTHPMYKD